MGAVSSRIAIAGHRSDDRMIGQCEALRGVQEDLAKIAPTNASVLVTGESGTGKELVARALHRQSGRAGSFVAINCGAVAPELLASELFGHERGAFTGAASRHVGLFEHADGGTVFLDEIAEMPPSLQVYLLRVLESGTLTRVGGTDTIGFDARVIAATNRDPMVAIDEGRLREDLFYRLADFIVVLPPLRERGNDCVELARHFIECLNDEHGLPKHLAAGAEQALLQYAWPGNVRELRSAIQRAYILSDEDEVVIRDPGLHRLPPTADVQPDGVNFRVGMSYAEIEREMLLKTLARYGNDKTRTARALGVSVRTIHNQLNRQDAGDVISSPARQAGAA